MIKLILISLVILTSCGRYEREESRSKTRDPRIIEEDMSHSLYERCINKNLFIIYAGSYQGNILQVMGHDGKPVRCNLE